MNILVTGANGFLGRHVVARLLSRGHRVRALARPAASVNELGWDDRVDVVRQDLRGGAGLDAVFTDVDAVVHLAAATSGDEEGQFASSVVGTERLLGAMARSRTRRLILCSTFSVYDFAAMGEKLREDSPLESDLYRRDGYAIAKFWQERVARRMAQLYGWDLTVLRPGFIWGRGHDYPACLGQRVGRVHLAIAPLARIPLTHVENCADCFAAAVDCPAAVGQTFNVVDGEGVRAWRYLGEYVRRNGQRGWRVPVPYLLGISMARLAQLTSNLLFKERGKLPSILVPIRFQARFRPMCYDMTRLRQVLEWQPPLSFDQCLERTFGRVSAPDPVRQLVEVEHG